MKCKTITTTTTKTQYGILTTKAGIAVITTKTAKKYLRTSEVLEIIHTALALQKQKPRNFFRKIVRKYLHRRRLEGEYFVSIINAWNCIIGLSSGLKVVQINAHRAKILKENLLRATTNTEA